MSEWSEAEKITLLLQIIAQFRPEKGKGGIDWDRIQLEGRTKKACQLAWDKFSALLRQQQAGGDGPVKSPAVKAKAAPRKRKVKKEQQAEAGSDDDGDAPSPTKKPRGRQRKPKVEDDIEVPSPDSFEDVEKYDAVKTEDHETEGCI